MRKLFLLLSLNLYIKGITQQLPYFIKVSYSGRFFCKYNSFNWRLSSSKILLEYNGGLNDITNTPPVILPFLKNGNPNSGLITKFDKKTASVFISFFENFTSLNPAANYQVQYQAFQNNLTPGVTSSPNRKI